MPIFPVFINRKKTKKKTLFVISAVTEQIGNKIWQSTTRFTIKRNVLSVITLQSPRITLNFISIKDTKRRTVGIWITFVLSVAKVSYSSFHLLLIFTYIKMPLVGYLKVRKFQKEILVSLTFQKSNETISLISDLASRIWPNPKIEALFLVKSSYLVFIMKCLYFFVLTTF